MELKVLVTRPEPGASATAARLAALGHEALVLPLSETVAVEPPDLRPEGIAAVAVTSANAVRHAPMRLIESFRRLPWLAVGSTTADVVAETGVADVTNVDGDAAALAGATLGRLGSGSRVVYLCGKVRVPDFEQMLRVSGLQVEILESYDTRDLFYPDEELGRLFGEQTVDAALIYSAKSAESLSRLMSRHQVRPLHRARLVAISHRAAAPLLAAGYAVQASASPNEAGMLRLLGGGSGLRGDL